MRIRLCFFAAFSLIAVLAGCAGSASTPGVTTSDVKVHVFVPSSLPAPAARHAQWVSPATRGVAILVTDNGATIVTVVADVSPGVPICTAKAAGRDCAVEVTMPRGQHHLHVDLYDAPPNNGAAAGDKLGSTDQAIDATQSGETDVTAGALAQAASIGVSVASGAIENPTTRGARTSTQTVTVDVVAYDAAKNAIDPSVLAQPIAVTIDGPSPLPLSPKTAIATNGTATFTYDGSFFENPMTITATSGGGFGQAQILPKHPVCTIPSSDRSVTLDLGSPAYNMKNGFGVNVSIGGGPKHWVEIDTGSRGLVVSASALGSNVVGPGAPGQMEYSSNGKVFHGNYYLAPLTFITKDASVTTIPVQVLAVSWQSCDPAYPNCTVDKNLDTMGNMGIAFDRPESLGGPVANPFLQLTDVVGGASHGGYILTKHGITLGVTANDVATYHTSALAQATPDPSATFYPGDWQQAKACFRFPDYAATNHCGTMLLDTGIPSMIVGLAQADRPAPVATASALPDGFKMAIDAPDATSPVLSYAFALGDGGDLTPVGAGDDPAARWSIGKDGPFVNTGRRVLNAYDYLFDASCGRVGFKHDAL